MNPQDEAATLEVLGAYAEAVRRLLAHGGYERSGDAAEARRWDIDHIRAYLDAQGRPDARRTVHVAGSKGKGSTATLTESSPPLRKMPTRPGARHRATACSNRTSNCSVTGSDATE